MKLFGLTSVREFLGDRIVYRNLAPVDQRLPALDDLRQVVGLAEGRVPRKSEANYAQVIVHILRRARELDAPGTSIKRLLFVGDTRLNDSTAFDNICQAGEWPGIAFIGSETADSLNVQTVSTTSGQTLYLANRWEALAEFDQYCRDNRFVVDEETAVIVDLDKTALGARGRNDHVINRARVQAVRNTVADLLGDDFDQATFETHYDYLNQVEFHPFTTDNQDYLAYICLILGTDLAELEQLVADVRSGALANFRQFVDWVDTQQNQLPLALADVHRRVYANVQAGDPTPFKSFRRNEFLTTVDNMRKLNDVTDVATLLADKIVITQEVRAQVLAWQRRGALLFGLSDKPDEASLPTPEQAAQGYEPIHRVVTQAVGRG